MLSLGKHFLTLTVCGVTALAMSACVVRLGGGVKNSTSGKSFLASNKGGEPVELTPTELGLKGAGLVLAADAVPGILVDMIYASENNFLGEEMYGDLKRCFLRAEASEKLRAAVKLMEERAPGLKLLLRDCARPRSVQAKMWSAVMGTEFEPLVANPYSPGSGHNFGVSVDVTLAKDGHELDMGSLIDDRSELASGKAKVEDRLKERGKLTAKQIANRRLLRLVMVEAGFQAVESEWWHFNAFGKTEFGERFPILE